MKKEEKSKMKDKTTKLLSFLLPFVMLLGMLPTTVFAGNGSTLELNSITITGVPMPQAGDKVRDYNNKKVASVTIATNPTGAVSGYDIDWYNDEGNNITTETFVAGTTYHYRVAVKMADGYCCTNPTGIDAELNGKKPTIIWFGSAWNGHTYNSFGLMNNYTIPATPIEKTYDLTTSVNGGNGSISDSKTGLAENAEETVIFTPDTGYEIDNVTVNGVKATVTGNQLKVTMTENKTVVVTYKKTETQNPTTYTISFDMNGHGTQVDAQTVNEGAKATKPADPTAEGYNFKGWYADENLTNEFDFETAIRADTTVYANWEKKADKPAEPSKPKVTFDNNGGTGSMPDATVDKGSSYTLPACTFTAPTGKEFKAWEVGGTQKAVGDNITVNANTTVKALWKDKPVIVNTSVMTIKPNGGKWADGTTTPKTYTVEVGKYFTLPEAPIKDGYTFLYWQGSKYNPGEQYLVTELDLTFTAVWQKNEVKPENKGNTSSVNTSKEVKTSPKTGDNGMLYVYALELLMAAGVMIILNDKRKNNNLK